MARRRLTCVLEAVVLGVVGNPFAIGGLGPSVGANAERESSDDPRELHFEDTTDGWIVWIILLVRRR